MKSISKQLMIAALIGGVGIPAWNVLGEDPPEPTKETLALYTKNCASCHGKDGKGDTKMGKKSKVLDYTDPEVQKKFDPVKALERVKKGVQEDGKDRMKPFGEKLKEPEIKALVAYMRTFGQKGK